MAPPPKSNIPPKRALPSKEAGLFKELLSLYETKQLKKAQKTADQILKKFPEHGETMCMKGLVLTHMGKKEEGTELVRKGVRLDLTSHIVWHVLGLVHKADKNYEEALKAYVQALKFDKENMNILRDAAQLQTQLRQFDGLVESRWLILKLRPNIRSNWVGLAVACHLNDNLPQAKRVLEQYEKIVKNVPDYDIEHSELLLYHVRVLEDLGELQEALTLLDTSAKSRSVVDKTSIMLIRARLLTKIGRKDEAEDGWRSLIEQNPECYDYYRGFLQNKDIDLDALTDVTRAKVVRVLRDFSELFPKARAPRRLALKYATSEDFKELVKSYLVDGLVRNIPSLFVDIKALYVDDEKRKIVETLAEEFLKQIQDGHAIDDLEGSEIPSTYVWTLYFLALHHSSQANHTRSLELIDIALEHTPSLPELYMVKARVLKRAGDPYRAAQWMESARKLDGQDRYLNTKTAKYMMRAGEIEEASKLLGLFTKKDAPSPGYDLEEMQSLQYLLEEGQNHLRLGKLGLALKRFRAVDRIFNDIEDDQFDFHAYCLRRFTLNIYISSITFEDRLRSHPAAIGAAIAASQIYVRVFDDPSVATTPLATLSEAEKKARKKARKAERRVEEVKKATPGDDKSSEAPQPPKDEDPDGTKLLTTAEPLEEALKLLQPLETLASDRIDVWIAVYDVAVRRKKYLHALKAISQAQRLDPDNADLHLRRIDLHSVISSLPKSDADSPVHDIITSAIPTLIPADVTPERFNSEYVQRHSSNPRSLLAGAKAAKRLGASREEVEGTVFGVVGQDAKADIQTALDALAFLREIKSPREEEFRIAAGARFELSTVFKLPSEIAVLKRPVEEGGNGDGGQEEVDH